MEYKKILDYYKTQGIRTKIKGGIFDKFPDNIEKICQIIRGRGVHPGDLHLYDVNFSTERIKDRQTKTVQEVIDKVKKINKKSLLITREIDDKIVIICRHFAMILAAILRSKGIPARCRCGFGTYFCKGRFEDHRICEYWDKKQKIRKRADAQIDKSKAAKKDLTHINFSDIPKDVFFPAGALRQLYRKGIISGDCCGFSLEEKAYGERYIRGNMLRDFFALNKIEYTYSEQNKLMDRRYKPNKEELLLLDKIAELTITVDDNFDALTKLYEKHKELFPK